MDIYGKYYMDRNVYQRLHDKSSGYMIIYHVIMASQLCIIPFICYMITNNMITVCA